MKKIKINIISLLFIFIIITSIIIGIVSYKSIYHLGEDSIGQKALSICKTISVSIDGDKFDELVKSESNENEYYEPLRRMLEEALTRTGATYLTTIIKKDNEIIYIADGSDPNGDEFSAYGDAEATSPEELFYTLFDKEKGGYLEMQYDPGWGYLITSLYPIKNSSGKLVGFIECDYSADILRKTISTASFKIFILLFFMILFSSSTLFFINKYLTKPLEEFTKKFKLGSQGDLSVSFDSNSKDNFKVLRNEFNNFIKNLNDIITNIKNLVTKVEKENSALVMAIDNIVNGKESIYFNEMKTDMKEGIIHLDQYVEEVLDNLQHQTTNTQESLAGLVGITSTENNIKKNTEATSISSKEAVNIAKASFSNIENMNDNMEDINESVKNTNNQVETLLKFSNEIGGIVTQLITLQRKLIY